MKYLFIFSFLIINFLFSQFSLNFTKGYEVYPDGAKEREVAGMNGSINKEGTLLKMGKDEIKIKLANKVDLENMEVFLYTAVIKENIISIKLRLMKPDLTGTVIMSVLDKPEIKTYFGNAKKN